jgi:hypothetical protein
MMDNHLLLRHSTSADLDALAAFNSRIHFFVPEHETTIPAMTRDLLSGRHPAFGPQDFTLVVEKSSGRIVSAMGLISQTWSYAGIPFAVGRPELVGTDPDYRGQGLVRAQFGALHQICRERGQQMQVITGIPFFYRQFGYELGIGSGAGLRGPGTPELLQAGPAGPEDYCISDAAPQDLGWIQAAYQGGCGRSLLACVRGPALWQYELAEKSDTNIHKVEMHVLRTRAGLPAGFFICPKGFGKVTEKTASLFELLPGVDWPAVVPAVLRFLALEGQREALQRGGACQRIGLLLGESHPAYAAAAAWLSARAEPGAWYVRVPDLDGFLNRIRPVLNARLAACRVSEPDPAGPECPPGGIGLGRLQRKAAHQPVCGCGLPGDFAGRARTGEPLPANHLGGCRGGLSLPELPAAALRAPQAERAAPRLRRLLVPCGAARFAGNPLSKNRIECVGCRVGGR